MRRAMSSRRVRWRRHPRILELIELFRKRHPEVLNKLARTDGGFVGDTGTQDDRRLRQGEAGAHSGLHARRERIPQSLRNSFALEVSPRSSLRISILADRSTRCSTCRQNRTPACSAATPTGAGPIWMPVNGLIIRGLLHMYPLLRQRLQSGMSHWLRKVHDAV